MSKPARAADVLNAGKRHVRYPLPAVAPWRVVVDTSRSGCVAGDPTPGPVLVRGASVVLAIAQEAGA